MMIVTDGAIIITAHGIASACVTLETRDGAESDPQPELAHRGGKDIDSVKAIDLLHPPCTMVEQVVHRLFDDRVPPFSLKYIVPVFYVSAITVTIVALP